MDPDQLAEASLFWIYAVFKTDNLRNLLFFNHLTEGL